MLEGASVCSTCAALAFRKDFFVSFVPFVFCGAASSLVAYCVTNRAKDCHAPVVESARRSGTDSSRIGMPHL